jgi:ABC-type protease/lipase transport system fused ATPase/permease subunit
VLDEPNASLDQEGEGALLGALERVKRAGTTAIMVAHRPSILVHADKLLVLEDGMVAQFGPRDEVAARLVGVRAGQSVRAA